MKVLKNLSLMVLLALAFAGCRGKSSQLADFNKQLYAPEYASGFKIERADGRQSVLVSVMNPWQGADSVTTRLFISRNGEPVPEGFDGQVLEGDAQRIVAMSSTHIAMLDAIGETARVVGVSGLDYIEHLWRIKIIRSGIIHNAIPAFFNGKHIIYFLLRCNQKAGLTLVFNLHPTTSFLHA